MGLFSKKIVACENCGKEYEVRIKIGKQICTECLERIQKKREKVFGYYEYGAYILGKDYVETDYDKIMERRSLIVEKYKNPLNMSITELKEAGDNYKKMTDEEAQTLLLRLSQSTAETTLGAIYTKYFFIPTIYKQLIVDREDVFAVALTTVTSGQQINAEVILAIVFTNDPYIPVFPMVFVGKLGYFELMKSKKGRREIAGFYEEMCPNLKYPVMDLKELKKQIKRDGEVNGEISIGMMKKIISDAESSIGIFNVKDLVSEPDAETAVMMNDMGYIISSDIDKYLQMDKMFQKNFWTKQMKKLSVR